MQHCIILHFLTKNHNFYPLAAEGLVIFRKFTLGEGAGKFLVQREAGPLGGAPKCRGELKILMNFVRM